MLKIAKDKLPALLQAWAAEAKVFTPQDRGGTSAFLPWDGKGRLTLGEGNTLEPPKDLFFPRTETMYRYQVQGQEAEITEVPSFEEKMVLVGVRSCDAWSFAIMDDVFLTKGYVDEFYRRRRENTRVVALACTEAAPTCFCTSFGLDPGRAEGVDVQMWPLDDGYLLEAFTEAGRELLRQAGDLLEEAGNAPLPASAIGFIAGTHGVAVAAPKLEVDVSGVVEKLQRMFEHPYWTALSRKCLGCGACTYLCPTCHCFDIQSENLGNTGYKFRCWDSCMFSEYTRMAGGHNPRPSKKERLRNRFLHKLQYFPERYGKFACVGCGRCLDRCPVNVDITRVIREVKEVTL
ncbi:4Fe-4S dicluster domain-containing protein [Thermanaeromonas sp. C210]|uniref:4Fe-4S dicluster domain-containing protein n=1 Tax=Thermanaeromonas sp. C210 TaxID=2731925 RepID=UPI00155CA9C3|nr:4Fe-4S dicluster domain-containing protein [Thermanaeromonas sp. C210]GFN24108.1 4Fe-4S ferredoxin [Thermanaeromonas sp. C210]